MEQMFRATDLESRISLNLNVLDADNRPGVMSLREALRAFLDHRKVVLERRSRFRLAKIEHRLEVLAGYIVAFLNLDEVIRIIREEDEPKAELMKTFDLTDVQADAILDMRLRSLRKLEEMELRREHATLTDESKQLKALLKSDDAQWGRISDELREIRTQFGPKTELGKRRTDFADAPAIDEVPIEALVEKEPITVICSEKGWVRAMKGHLPSDTEVKYKDGDRAAHWLHAETTDKLILFGTNGRFYTLGCDKLPGGRGNGEPVRLMVDLKEDADIAALMVHDPKRTLLVAASDGRGFLVNERDVVASTRTGKQVLNVSGDVEAAICVPATGDWVAVVGENRKMLIFPRAELPEMTRGRGVILQRYKDGGLSDAKLFDMAAGLTWQDRAGRTHTQTDLDDWIGKRAQAGRTVPRGFPRNNRFA